MCITFSFTDGKAEHQREKAPPSVTQWVTSWVVRNLGVPPRSHGRLCHSVCHDVSPRLALCVLGAWWLIHFLPRRRAHHSQMCWVPQSPWAQPRGRSSASPHYSCCAKSCRFLRMSQSWPRSSPWFMNSTALDSSCPTWVRRQSPSSKPLGRIIMSLHPRSAFSVAAHYSKGDKSKHPFQIYPAPSCPVWLGPWCPFFKQL